jgi:hypothetical protein
MRPILILIAIVLSGALARAQQVVDLNKTDYKLTGEGMAVTSVNGLIYSPVKFVKVTAGTPFFKEQWMKGTLVAEGGQAYKNLELRLNVMDNEVNYKDAKGQEMITSSPIKYVILTDSSIGEKYEFALGDQMKNADKSLARTWFQVLVNGKVSLCMEIHKKIHESIAYGTATTEQDIVTVNYYYLQMNNNFARFRWEDWQDPFKDKKDQLAQFIKTNHLKGKTAEDYTKLVEYYNTL